MNSTFGIVQLLYVGAAIEGDWMKVHKYMLDHIYIPDPTVITEKYKEAVDSLFDEVSEVPMPSFIDQLRSNHNVRKKNDKFFIETLNLDISEQYKNVNKFLIRIQEELLEELKGLCPSQF